MNALQCFAVACIVILSALGTTVEAGRSSSDMRKHHNGHAYGAAAVPYVPAPTGAVYNNGMGMGHMHQPHLQPAGVLYDNNGVVLPAAGYGHGTYPVVPGAIPLAVANAYPHQHHGNYGHHHGHHGHYGHEHHNHSSNS